MSMRGAARVVCVGDSITFGEHVTSDRRWTTLMALARPEWNVLNRGVNGEVTELEGRGGYPPSEHRPSFLSFGTTLPVRTLVPARSRFDGSDPRLRVPPVEALL